jgi:hypothetical protein
MKILCSVNQAFQSFALILFKSNCVGCEFIRADSAYEWPEVARRIGTEEFWQEPIRKAGSERRALPS